MGLAEISPLDTSLAVLTALAISAAGTGFMRNWLLRHQRLDRPNERSSHRAPTPRGAGPAFVFAIVAAWIVGNAFGRVEFALSLGAGALCLLGWFDDRQPLSPALKLAVQAGVILALLPVLPIPFAFYPLVFLAWLWMVNLTNFMDGIDGITGMEIGFIGLAILLIAPRSLGPQSAALIGAALGFLLWNWAPAKIFLGDSGSLPLGLISGGLLIELGLEGAIAAALLIPGAYLFDATLTLVVRAWRREIVWHAHRSHAYQRHARAIGSHAQAVNTLIIVNLMLLALAILSLDPGHEALALVLGLGILAAYFTLVRRAEIRAKRNAGT